MSEQTFTYDVFLSHNHADKPRARRLAERLKAAGVRMEAGLRLWLDEWGIPKSDLHPSSFDLHPLHAGRRFIPLLPGDCALPDTLRRYKVVDSHSCLLKRLDGTEIRRPTAPTMKPITALAPSNTPIAVVDLLISEL